MFFVKKVATLRFKKQKQARSDILFHQDMMIVRELVSSRKSLKEFRFGHKMICK